MFTKILLFSGGVAVGLLIADLYAKAKISNTIHTGLSSVGLGGGTIEDIANKLIQPS